MDKTRAEELRSATTDTLLKWSEIHPSVTLVLGRDYLSAVDLQRLGASGVNSTIVPGPIFEQNHHLHKALRDFDGKPRPTFDPQSENPLYFLPDWDDMLDTRFDFKNDRFSSPTKQDRDEVHCTVAMRPDRICDGILVSLAQNYSSKGLLRQVDPTGASSLAPPPLRSQFGLTSNQWLFGDCGAFSYVNEFEPTVTPEQAVALYEVNGFDLGASVDHIPVSYIKRDGERVELDDATRALRIDLTSRNAAKFIELHRKHKCRFTPVGTIQGVTPSDYGSQIHEYLEYGYQHLALGGLVPRQDSEILEIGQEVASAIKNLSTRPWIHLFGVFRPRIHTQLKTLGISSFDSATYFRKAWLRSSQNYLSTDGSWYAAIRVPMTSDPRTKKRLEKAGHSIGQLKKMERRALAALHEYGEGDLNLETTLESVIEYDSLLSRSSESVKNREGAYRQTLENRPWEKCSCSVCKSIGIDALIFRGSNRNKRRGAHNTLMLYTRVNDESI